MDENRHVFSDGTLERHQDTIRVRTDDGETKPVPIENTNAVFLHGQINYNTRVVSFLNDHGVAAHVFGWNDRYAGSILPERGQTSGQTVVEQVRAYDDPGHRRRLAAAFVRGSIHNMRRNVAYYDNRGRDLSKALDGLDDAAASLNATDDVETIMGHEATARRAYYGSFDAILRDDWGFESREYNPPPNAVNSLLSYGNSLVYTSCISAIRKTALDPTVSYLHEPGERRFSLAYDIADLFKPVISDRVTFRLLNQRQLSSDDFREDVGAVLLTDDGRETYTRAFENTLARTKEHERLGRPVSYQYLLQIEAYKLKKHLLTGEDYDPFERWW